MDYQLFLTAVQQISEEKGISRERVIETLEMALAAAYKKEYNRKGQNIKTELDMETGDIKVFQVKLVVDESMLKPETDEEEDEEESKEEETENEEERKVRYNPEKHIMMDEMESISSKEALFNGKKLTSKTKEKIQPGDEIEFPLDVPSNFGRIAAQTAKQVIIQRVREAERETIFSEFREKEGEVISGIVQRIENGKVFFDLGKATGILFPEEQIPGERHQVGKRMRVYLAEVEDSSRTPMIYLSRAHPKIVTQLFNLEVPEIASGTVEIKSIAREAGSRSKIAVTSTEERVDPIGSMIGQRGTRVQAVINELNGEKIDIIEWSENPSEYIAHALSPAKITSVEVDEKQNQAKVVVPEDQLSLTIGVEGQNVRLAARLTGWKIDVITQEGKTPEEMGIKKVSPKPENKDQKEAKTEDKKDTSKKEKEVKSKEKKKKEPQEPKDKENKPEDKKNSEQAEESASNKE